MKGKGQTIHELTRVEAYLLSEKAGHPSHMHDFFWSQAEGIVRQRLTIVETAVKASREKAPKAAKAASVSAKPAMSKAKRMPEAQLPLGDVSTAAKKPKTATPTKKTVATPAKVAPKKAVKPK